MAMAEGPASEGHLLGTSPQSKDLHIVTHLDVHVLEPKGRRANGHGPKGQGFMVGKLVGKKKPDWDHFSFSAGLCLNICQQT